MFGYQHNLAPKPVETRIALGLTWQKLLALLVGGKLTYEFAKIVPPLPFENFVIAHIHHLIPLVLVMAFALITDRKTGLSLPQYLWYWINFKTRKKVFIWRRG